MEPENEGTGQHPMLMKLSHASMAAIKHIPQSVQPADTAIRFGQFKETWRTLFRRGCTALDKGNMPDALEQFKTALQKAEGSASRSSDPSISICANAVGFCYQLLGAFTTDKYDAQYFNQQAYEYYNRAFRVDEDNMPRYRTLTLFFSSKMYMNRNETEKAQRIFTQGLSLMGDEKPIWPMPITTAAWFHHQGLLHIKQGKYDEAEEAMKSALRLLSAKMGHNHAWTRNVEKLVNALHQYQPGEILMLDQTDQMVNQEYGRFLQILVDELRLMPKS